MRQLYDERVKVGLTRPDAKVMIVETVDKTRLTDQFLPRRLWPLASRSLRNEAQAYINDSQHELTTVLNEYLTSYIDPFFFMPVLEAL